MRVLAPVALAAMTLLFAGWTLSSDDTIAPGVWNPRGKAVVKTLDGVSHIIRTSRCSDTRLRFGGTAIDSDLPYMQLVLDHRERKPGLRNVIDGVLRLAPNANIAVVGTAHARVLPTKRGRFVLFTHEGGTLGKPYTGTWNCG